MGARQLRSTAEKERSALKKSSGEGEGAQPSLSIKKAFNRVPKNHKKPQSADPVRKGLREKRRVAQIARAQKESDIDNVAARGHVAAEEERRSAKRSAKRSSLHGLPKATRKRAGATDVPNRFNPYADPRRSSGACRAPKGILTKESFAHAQQPLQKQVVRFSRKTQASDLGVLVTANGSGKRPIEDVASAELPPATKRIRNSPEPPYPHAVIYRQNEWKRKASEAIDADLAPSTREALEGVHETGQFLKKRKTGPVTTPVNQPSDTGCGESKIGTTEVSNTNAQGTADTKEPTAASFRASALSDIDKVADAHQASPSSKNNADSITNSATDHVSSISNADSRGSSPLSSISSNSSSIPKNFKDDSGMSGSTSSKTTPDLSPVNNFYTQPSRVPESNPWHLRGLMNGGAACFQNSTLQCLHALPLIRKLFQSLESQPAERIKDNNLLEEILYLCALRDLPKDKYHEKDYINSCKLALKTHLAEREDGGLLSLSQHLASVFVEMSRKKEMPINKYLLQQVFGRTLQHYMIDDENDAHFFDGESQEDATDFLRQLLVRIKGEIGKGSAEQYMKATVRTRRSCRSCGLEKEISESSHIHEASFLSVRSRKLEELAASLFPLASKDVRFTTACCDGCNSTAGYTDIKKWERARLVNPNPYLVFNVSRRGRTSIIPTLDDIEVPAVSNGQCTTARYILRAVTTYSGTGNSGHYTALRRHHGKWFLCDDAIVSELGLHGRRGVLARMRYGRVFFYEKAD